MKVYEASGGEVFTREVEAFSRGWHPTYGGPLWFRNRAEAQSALIRHAALECSWAQKAVEEAQNALEAAKDTLVKRCAELYRLAEETGAEEP